MLGPPTQQQQPQQQSYPQYQNQLQHLQYAQESRQQPPQQQHPKQQQQQQQYPSTTRPQSGEMNHPFQPYSSSYAQQPSPYAQLPSQQHPQHQQGHPSQQQQLQQAQRSYVGHQLPPLGPPMGSAPPPGSYMPGQPMPPQPGQPHLGPPSIRPSLSAAPPRQKELSYQSAHNGYVYSLEVVQQPQRARMCGFGDKDRRPITPPPCVRLVITDEKTGREVDIDSFPSDPSFFLLQCDLWAENADREANVVRASSNSPAVSISSATTTSYPPPAENGPRHMHEQPHGMYIDSNGNPVFSTMPGYPVLHRTGSGAYPQQQYPGGYYPQMGGPPQVSHMPPQAAQPTSAMYTRNLIGSLTVNAAKLNDDQKKPGYWFVLQDLSVRTEGYFRLRMGFVDISAPPVQPPASSGANGSTTSNGGVNRGKARTLAWVYSAPFQVYSAKKFPGVIESTPLSKAFAQQGIKIPIRKDNKGDDDEGVEGLAED